MITHIIIDTTPIKVDNFSHTTIADEEAHDLLRKLTLDFQVTNEMYHDITTLLYKDDFTITIPGKNITFPGKILNYSTSITNLYEEGNVGTFHLELIEKNREH